MTRTEQLAWIAGFVDGEGSIVLAGSPKKSNGGRYMVRVLIPNTRIEALQLIQTLFGGSIVKRPRRNPKHKTVYALCLSCRKAMMLIRAIRPFLILKQAQADLAIAFESTLKPRRGRGKPSYSIEELAQKEVLRAEMQDLNMRGIVQ